MTNLDSLKAYGYFLEAHIASKYKLPINKLFVSVSEKDNIFKVYTSISYLHNCIYIINTTENKTLEGLIESVSNFKHTNPELFI